MQYSRLRGLVLELNGNEKVFFSERDAKITKLDLSTFNDNLFVHSHEWTLFNSLLISSGT